MERYNKVKIASILGVIGNLFLCLIKGIIGHITHSEAMIADTFNSAGDIVSSLMTYIGNKVASKPSDEDHNLGHGKAEYIYSMLVSIIIIISSFYIFKSSITSLLNHSTYEFSIYLIYICLLNIIIKLSLYIYTNKIAQKYHNLLIKANSKDHRNDAIISALNLISVICALNNLYYIDSIVAILIGIWVFISGFKIFKESYDVLMDKCISDDIKNQVLSIINNHSEIKKINHFNSTPVGYKYQISFTIFVDGNLSTFDSHQIADNLEKEIGQKIDEIYLTVIHVNPIESSKKI